MTVLKKLKADTQYQFSCTKVVFLGHVIDANGVSPDPAKTEAIQKMRPPTNVTGLRRLMGMINQLPFYRVKETPPGNLWHLPHEP